MTTRIDNFDILTLPNGLRCILRSYDGPAFANIAIGAGSRDDFPEFPGLAHFVEHTVFRGTERRNGFRLNALAEDVGGGLNAYTSREMTVYYGLLPSAYLSRGLDILSDVVGSPAFPSAEIEREKTIIFEEIKSDIDTPDEAIFDDASDRLFAGSQLGHNILGTYTSVRDIHAEQARTFIKNLYTPENMVLACGADMPINKMERLVEKYMSRLQRRPTLRPRPASPMSEPFDVTVDKGLAQCHTVMATRVFDGFDSRRHAMHLLRYYLGSGMNSLLFRELREKRGYVYTVEAGLNLYSDAGDFYVYFGAAKENVAKCRKLIVRLLEKLAESPMKPSVFAKLKRNFAGRREILNSAVSKRAGNAARELLIYGQVSSKSEKEEILDSITAEQLRECAQLLLERPLSTLSYT